MHEQNIFPRYALAEGLSEPAIKLEGQKVVFDKKVSLLPADVRKEITKKVKAENGKSPQLHRQRNGR